MPISRSMPGVIAVALFSVWQGAYAQSPLPQVPDGNFQACLNEQAARNGWAYAEQVTVLSCPNRGIARIEGVQLLPNLADVDLSGNQFMDATTLGLLSKITKLNLAGNQLVQGRDLGMMLGAFNGLASLNLNGINIGSINNLNGLINPRTGQPWPLVELNLGNTHLVDAQNGKSLDFLRNAPNLKKVNFAGNGINSIDALGMLPFLEEVDLSNNRVQFVAFLRGNSLTRLNLSGNRQVQVQEVAQLISHNPGLTSLGLNGIAIGNIMNLGPLTDSRNGQPLALTELDLGNTGIKDVNGNASLQFLMPFMNLRKLNLANLGLSDVSALAPMMQLTELDLSGNQLASLGQIGQLRNLTRLNLSGNRNLRFDEVANLLRNNPNLVSVGLNGISIGQGNNVLGMLAGNPAQASAMQELDLGNTRIDANSLGMLQAFPNLQRLNLAGNNFVGRLDLGALNNMRNLRELDLSGNAIGDVYSLLNLRGLTRLNLSGTGLRITDVRPLLEQNQNLTSIGLNGVMVGDFSNLGALRNNQSGQPYALTELDLGNTGLRGTYGNAGFDFLRQFSGLQKLNLAGNGIIDFTGYQDFQELQELDLSNNRLQFLPPGQQTRLTRLNLSGNPQLRVQDIAVMIAQNPGLQSLGLNGITVGNFNNLGPLTDYRSGQPYGLTELDLGNTGLLDQNGQKTLSFLAPFANLQRLNLAGNGLITLNGLGNPSRLVDLDLSNNQFVELNLLSSTHGLTRLNLSGNRSLRFDGNLVSLISGNPHLSSLGLNGISIPAFSNLTALLNNPGQADTVQELDLGNTGIDINTVGQLQMFPNLLRLNLAGNGLPPEASYYVLRNMRAMQDLDLSGNRLPDVSMLLEMHNLVRLNLSGTGVRINDVRVVLDQNVNLTSIGLNGIAINATSDLGALFNGMSGQPYNLTEFDLGNTGLQRTSGGRGFDFLRQFANLQKLNLAGNGIVDIYEFRDLQNLQELDLSNNLIQYLAVGNQTRLQRLNLSGNPLARLAEVALIISQNPDLKSLGLNGIVIGNITNLGPLVNNRTGQPLALTGLDLGNTGLLDQNGQKSISFLSAFSGLQRLNVAGNGLTSLSGLTNAANLLEVDLSNNNLQDVSPLLPARNLTRLNLSGNPLLNIAQVRPLLDQSWNLTSLGLNGIALSDFSALGQLFNPQSGSPYNLQELDLGNTRLSAYGNTNPRWISAFPNLTRVNLAGNGLISLQGFEPLQKVVDLDVSNNQLLEVNAISALRGLSSLNLSGNSNLPVWAVAPLLMQNPGLTRIGLNGIRLGTLGSVGNFYGPSSRPLNLLELDIGNTQLQDIDGLNFVRDFPGLTRLNVAGNGLRSAYGVHGLPNVRDLDLSNNALVIAGDLYGIRSLQTLNLQGNTTLQCVDLDNLVASLPGAVVRRPVPCVTQNQPPVADAGANQSVTEGGSVVLSGTGTDIDGTISSYAWLQTAGPAVSLSAPNAASSSFIAPPVVGDTLLSFQLTVFDDKGASASSTTNVLVKQKVNQAPVANAGANQTVASGSQVTLAGTGTDSDGSISSYGWLQVAGPAVTLATPAAASTSFIAPVVTVDTVFTFQLTVQDDKGASATSTVNVTVKAKPNQPPVANAGSAQTVISGSSVTLAGSGTDSDGTIASYAWLQTGGPAVTLATPAAAGTTFIAPAVTVDTVFSFQLTVQDDKGATATSSVSITVKPKPNVPPVANAGSAQTVISGSSVTLTGSGTDSDGSIAGYAWLQSAGPAVTLATPAAAGTTFIAPVVTVDTVFSFQLTVQDDKGATATSSVSITVKPKPNVPPVANAGSAQTVISGSSVTLTGSGTDSDGSIAGYAWLQTAGPAVVLSAPKAAASSFTAPVTTVDTVLSFTLTVVDDKGAAASSNVSITVKAKPNVPPLANAGSPQSVFGGSTVTLAGSGSDSDGTIASYGWTQTGGPAVTLATPKAASSTFVAPLVTVDTVFSFTLTVFDDKGASATSGVTVTVKPKPNQAPTVSAGSAQTVVEGASVTLTGTAQDADGSIASYAWVQTAGPAVTLATPKAASTTFVAPQVSADTVLSFKLTVTDNQGAVASATTSVTVKDAPDLKVSNVYVVASRTNPPRGSTIPVTVTTLNSGNKPTAAASSTALYLSTSSTSIDVGAAVLSTVSVPSGMAAGASLASSTSITIPSTMAPGVYYLWGVADYTGKVAEGNESNNRLVGPKITVY